MDSLSSANWMIALNVTMIIYTLWTFSLRRKLGVTGIALAVGSAVWLAALHLGLQTKSLFHEDVGGSAFLALIFAGVGCVGLILFLPKSLRRRLLELDQTQLMLAQGIRVFYGATFLMYAAIGVLPKEFGIIDGLTHISAGFFGLVAAYLYSTGQNGRRRVWFANIFGLTDIVVVASSIAFFLLPNIGPHHVLMYAVFLPAPVWVWLHVLSIRELMQTARSTNAHHLQDKDRAREPANEVQA